jgi:hypothetical protein
LKLSDDYSPFGRFATQVLHITLIGIICIGAVSAGLVFVLNVYSLLVLLAIVVPILFFIWGMRKQDRELFNK